MNIEFLSTVAVVAPDPSASWASDDSSAMQVGRFMVDQTGGCRVSFNLPADHPWNHFVHS